MSAARIKVHRMRFNRLATRDFSSSPTKTGGASHRRMFVNMVELLKTADHFRCLYNNSALGAMDSLSPLSQEQCAQRTAIEPLEWSMACKFLPAQLASNLILPPVCDQSCFEFYHHNAMIAIIQLKGIFSKPYLFLCLEGKMVPGHFHRTVCASIATEEFI